MAAELKILQPSNYYSIYLDKGVRPDGRQLTTFGPMNIFVGCLKTANGSAMVSLRETKVLCGIKAGLTNPEEDRPNEGFVVPNIEFPPVCSGRFKPGPPTEEAQIYSQLMVDLLKNSSLVNLQDLCLSEGKLCWCLHVDVVCLNYGGNILDACVLALLTALKNTSLPKVLIEADAIEVLEETHFLNIRELPFCSTFAVFGDFLVADPTAEEEELSEGLISIFMKENGTICNIHMMSSFFISSKSLKICIRQCKDHCKKLASLVRQLKNK